MTIFLIAFLLTLGLALAALWLLDLPQGRALRLPWISPTPWATWQGG
jgi:hypothetical protein